MAEPLPAVVIGNPQTIAYGPGLNAGPQIVGLANDDLIVPIDRYEGAALAESWVIISPDLGKTWRKCAAPWSGSVAGQLRDGTILTIAVRSEGPPKRPGLYTYPAQRGNETWESLQSETITVNVPAVTGTGDDLKSFCGVIPWNRLVEMPDGDLLMTAYGYFEGDDVPIEVTHEPYRPKPWPYPGYNKYRTVLLRSDDQGRTWHYVSTVAYDPSSGEEGPCEPSMVRTKGGDLLCIMRTGRVNALRTCRSSDRGKTWTALEPILGPIGVAPFLTVMQNGTLACIYGMKEDYWALQHRRELGVIFSFDHGKTWPLNGIVYAGEASSYASLCEVAPGELMACFSSPGLPMPPGEERGTFVCLTRISLRQAPAYKWP